MLKYTRAAISKTLEDIKNLARFFEFLAVFIQIPFGIINLATGSGVFAVNLVMLILSTAYFILYLVVNKLYGNGDKQEKKKGKRVKSKGKRIIHWLKRPVQLYNFAVIIYGMFAFTLTDIDTILLLPFKITLLVFQIIIFVISLVIDLLAMVIERRKKFFEEAFQADVNETIKEPTRKTGNFFKKIIGKEPTPQPTQTKTERILDEFLEEQNREKQKEKDAKKAEKQAKKLAKQAEKQAKKAGKGPTDSEAEAEVAAAEELTRVRVIDDEDLNAFEEFSVPAEQAEKPTPKRRFFRRK